jgi:hypothetical protein
MPRTVTVRKRGQASRYLNGSESKLVSNPRDFDDPGIIGLWSREQLICMDADFVAALEKAFRSGRESPASASANVVTASDHRPPLRRQ